MRIVLTGSSSGIGQLIAERILREGNHVWGIARSDQKNQFTDFGDLFESSICDVGNWEELEKISHTVETKWKSINAIIACAGIQGAIGKTLSLDPILWKNTVNSNLIGTFNTIRAFNFLFKDQDKRSKVICFSGGGGTQARPHFSAYGTAKTGIIRLVETIASEEVSRAMDINCIAPGSINTRLTDEVIAQGATQAGEREYATALEQKKNGGQSIDKAIDLILWLLSSKSDGVSGKILSAQWDNWGTENIDNLKKPELYKLRRTTP